MLCAALMFLPGVPGGGTTSGIDSDGDGCDDDTGEPFSDSDGDGIDDLDEEFGFEINVLEFQPDPGGSDEHQGEMGYWMDVPLWITTDPNDPDSDGDLIGDGAERDLGMNPADPADGNADHDGDLLTAGEEYLLGTSDWNLDSDFGGVEDGTEVWLDGTDPTLIDDDMLGTDPEEGGDTGEGNTGGDGTGTGNDGTGDGSETGSNGGGDGTSDGGDSGTGDGENAAETNRGADAATAPDSPPQIFVMSRNNRVSGGPSSTELETRAKDDQDDLIEFHHLIDDGWEEVYKHSTPEDEGGTDEDGNPSGHVDKWSWKVERFMDRAEGQTYDYEVTTNVYSGGQNFLESEILVELADIENGHLPDLGSVNAALQLTPLTAEVRKDRGVSGGDVVQSFGVLSSGGEFPHASHADVWLYSDKPVPEAVSRTFLAVVDINGTKTATTVTLTIPKDGQTSTESGTEEEIEYVQADAGVVKLTPEVTTVAGENRNASLLPVEFEEVEPETGLDDFTYHFPDDQPDRPSFSVRSDQDDYNELEVVSPELDGLFLFTDSETETFTPDTSDGTAPQNVTISTTVDKGVEAMKIGDKDSKMGGKVLDIYCYDRFEINISVSLVTIEEAGKPTLESNIEITVQEIEEYLSSVFGRQCNVHFKIDGGIRELTADYSLLTAEPFGDADKMNIYGGHLSTEEEDILLSAKNEGMISVFLIPAQLQTLDLGNPAGFAKDEPLVAYVSLEDSSKQQLLKIFAHELGHLPLSGIGNGLDHPWTPDEETGELNPHRGGFPTTKELDNKRLMAPYVDAVNEVDPELGRLPARLVRREWEIIRGIN